jgi:hypothetical protein
LHVAFVDSFDRYLTPRKLVNCESDLPKSTFTDKFNEFVKILRGWWQLPILLQIQFVILDEPFTLFHDVVIDSESVFINNDIVDNFFGCAFSR